MAAGLTIAAASMGLGGVPAQAAGGTPSISAGPNVVVGEADGSVHLPGHPECAGSSAVTVNYATSNGSGTLRHRLLGQLHLPGPRDTVSFAPGVTTQERDRQPLELPHSSSGFYTFYLNLFSASGATIVDNLTQVDVTGNAPAAGATSASSSRTPWWTPAPARSRSRPAGRAPGSAQAQPVTVNYTTVDGSARPGRTTP